MGKLANKMELPESALGRLINREEILQICYWYQGEGLGDIFDAKLLQPFLNYDEDQIEIVFNQLLCDDYLEFVSVPHQGYRLTASGKQQGGKLFADSFSDFQKPGHGECVAGCCDDGDHSQCGDDCLLH